MGGAPRLQEISALAAPAPEARGCSLRKDRDRSRCRLQQACDAGVLAARKRAGAHCASAATCAGASAILDMMLRWIAQHSDRRLADEVAQHLLIGRQRAATEGQAAQEGGPGVQGGIQGGVQGADRDAIANQAVARALAIMQETIEEPLSCRALAAEVDLSPRQLQRHFQHYLGTTVMRHYLLQRLAKAHKLLQQTDLRVTEVAVSAGFTSLEHFSRVYRQTFGVSPSADRQQSTSAPVLRQRGRPAPPLR